MCQMMNRFEVIAMNVMKIMESTEKIKAACNVSGLSASVAIQKKFLRPKTMSL